MTTIGMLTLVTFIVASFLFIIKHFVVDFWIQLYQKDNMAKFNSRGWLKPLAKHCVHHAVATIITINTALLVAAGYVVPEGYVSSFTFMENTSNELSGMIFVGFVLGLGAFDFVTHLIIDRIKAAPDMLGRYKVEDRAFWICLGLDQAAHAVVHFILALALTLFVYYYGMVVPAVG